jgi:hypothetical protein
LRVIPGGFFLFWVEGATDARALNRLASQEFMKFFSKTCAQKNTNPMAQVHSSIFFFKHFCLVFNFVDDFTSLQLEHTQDTQKVMCYVVASQSGLEMGAFRIFFVYHLMQLQAMALL